MSLLHVTVLFSDAILGNKSTNLADFNLRIVTKRHISH